jgi:hypothetical protein
MSEDLEVEVVVVEECGAVTEGEKQSISFLELIVNFFYRALKTLNRSVHFATVINCQIYLLSSMLT